MSGRFRGYIPPTSLLTPANKKMMSTFNKKYKNSPIRMGCIVSITELDDEEKNISQGKVVEYDVITEEQNENGSNFVTYQNCISIVGFGGVGDFFEYKLRTSDDESFKKTYDFNKQNGSMVLLLCIDGYSEKAVIVGGVKHYKRKTTLTKEAGLHMEGEYNGLNWQVNKEGELTITFKSKTNNKGEPQNETAGGTYLKIDEKGSIDLNTALEDETSIQLNKEDKDVNINAGNNISNKAKVDYTVEAEANISGKAKANVEFEAEGAAKVVSKSSLDLEGKSVVNVKGGNVMITGNNGVMIKGNQCTIDTPKVFVGQGGAPALISTTQFVGKGNKGAPVVSTAIGPFSSSVFIAS